MQLDLTADRTSGKDTRPWINYGSSVGALVIYLPLASAIRGFSQQVGQVALLAGDMFLLLMFFIAFTRSEGTKTYVVLSWLLLYLTLYCLVYPLAASDFPSWIVTYEGFRKSVMWLVAIYVGRSLPEENRGSVISIIYWTLFAICIYGVKQIFVFSDFDRALLDVQAASVYANEISGQQRAISVLSSGFHLGMAGCILVGMALWHENQKKWRSIVVILVALTAISASITRTFIGIAAILVVVRMLYRHVFVAFVALLCLVITLLLLELANVPAVSIITELLLSDNRVVNRFQSYVAFWSYLSTFPHAWFVGFGPGSAGSTLGADFGGAGAPWIEPHNIFSKYVFEFGAPVAITVWLVVGQIVGQCRSVGSYQAGGGWAAMATLVISGLTITSVEASPVSLYVGLIVGAMSGGRRSAEAHQ